MNFDFSDEQTELRNQAQRMLGKGTQRARAHVSAAAPWDAELWRQAVDMGWTAAAIPEALGGLGLGALELCVLAEETGRVLAPMPLAASVLQGSQLLLLALQDEAHSAAAKEWLPRLAAGEVVATVALTEAGGGLWGQAPATTVQGGLLTGSKQPVAHAAGADVAVVSARAPDDGDGFGLWLVDLRTTGVQRQAMQNLDLVNPHGCLVFEQAAAQRIGAPGGGARLIEQLTLRAAIFTAFEQLGSAEGAMALALNYVKTRKVFGREVGGYQAIKHRLADMYVKLQLARSHAYYGAWALAHDAPELAQAAAGARLAATDAFNFASEEAVQLHGGIGFTWDCDAQLFYRRARTLGLALGGRQHWAGRLVRSMQSASPLPVASAAAA